MHIQVILEPNNALDIPFILDFIRYRNPRMIPMFAIISTIGSLVMIGMSNGSIANTAIRAKKLFLGFSFMIPLD